MCDPLVFADVVQITVLRFRFVNIWRGKMYLNILNEWWFLVLKKSLFLYKVLVQSPCKVKIIIHIN